MANLLTYEPVIRTLAAHGLADSTTGFPYPNRLNIVNKTADYTIVPNDPCGTTFTNGGDNNAIIFTLPAPAAALKGVYYDFANICTPEQSMTITVATADTLITKNDPTATSIAMSTSSLKLGGLVRMMCLDGNGAGTYQWMGVPLAAGITYTYV